MQKGSHRRPFFVWCTVQLNAAVVIYFNFGFLVGHVLACLRIELDHLELSGVVFLFLSVV
jgi:hypothetical protein